MSFHALKGLIIAGILLTQHAVALETGQPVPPWTLTSSEGTEIEFPHIAEGRPAILVFWSATCASCPSVLSILQAIRTDYISHEVEIYAIPINRGETISSDADTPAYDFVMLTAGEDTAREYGVEQAPEVIVVDQRGKLAARLVGSDKSKPVDWNADLRSALNRLVKTDFAP